MTKEERAHIADYFEAPDLVDFLRLKTEDIIDAFEDDVIELLDDLLEIAGIRNADEESLLDR